MVSTREVFAVIAGLCFLAGFVAVRFDRAVAGSWLFAAGSAFATLWSVAGIALVGSGSDPGSGAWALPPEGYFALAGMAATAVIYYGHRALTQRSPI